MDILKLAGLWSDSLGSQLASRRISVAFLGIHTCLEIFLLFFINLLNHLKSLEIKKFKNYKKRLSLGPFNLVCQLGWKFNLPERLGWRRSALVEHTQHEKRVV